MFLHNRKRINLTIEEKNWTLYFIIFDSENWKNPPSQFYYFSRARKQRNKDEKRNKSECNKNEWGQSLPIISQFETDSNLYRRQFCP